MPAIALPVSGISPLSLTPESIVFPLIQSQKSKPGLTAEDQVCQQQIEELLRDQQYQGLKNVLISSDRGTVTLQGRVSSFYLRQICIRCCQQVVGVFQINDRLEVSVAQ